MAGCKPGTPDRARHGAGTGFGSQNDGLISGETGEKKYLCGIQAASRRGIPCGDGSGGSIRGERAPGEQIWGVSEPQGWQVPGVSTDGSHGPSPRPPFGVEPVGEGRLVERDPLLPGQGDLPAQLVGDHPGVHGRLAQHRGLRGAGQG